MVKLLRRLWPSPSISAARWLALKTYIYACTMKEPEATWTSAELLDLLFLMETGTISDCIGQMAEFRMDPEDVDQVIRFAKLVQQNAK